MCYGEIDSFFWPFLLFGASCIIDPTFQDTPPRHLDHNYYKASDNPPAGEEDPPAGVKYVEYRPNSLYPLTTKSNPTLGSIQSNVDPWRPNKPKPEGKLTQVFMDKGNYNSSKRNGAGTVVINGHPVITPLKLQTGKTRFWL